MRQRGFTLLELLIAMAVSSLLLPVLVLTMRQLTVDTGQNTARTTALDNVESAARTLSEEVAGPSAPTWFLALRPPSP